MCSCLIDVFDGSCLTQLSLFLGIEGPNCLALLLACNVCFCIIDVFGGSSLGMKDVIFSFLVGL